MGSHYPHSSSPKAEHSQSANNQPNDKWRHSFQDDNRVIDQDLQQQLLLLSQEILIQFHTLLRTTTFHLMNNRASLQVIDKILSSFQVLLQYEYEIHIEYTGSDFLVNERWTRLSRRYQEAFKNLKEMFALRKIGSLWISALPSREDLGIFVSLFHSISTDSEDPFHELQSLLWQHQIEWLSITKFEESLLRDVPRLNLHTYVRQTYFYAIHTTQQLYVQASQSKPLKLKTAKRIIQAFVEIFVNPRARQEVDFLLFLTQIKNSMGFIYNHAVNVAILSIGFAHSLGLSRNTLRDIGIAAILHDIGQVKIPKHILENPHRQGHDKLLYERHPVFAVPLILNTSFIDSAILRSVNIAFSHHLGIQHGGYPDYGWGTQSLASQIIQIADLFDEMTTFRKGHPPAKAPPVALAEIAMMPRSQLHSILVRKFIDWYNPMPLGTVVRLQTGEIGYVILAREEGRPHDRPVIQIISLQSPRYGESVDLMEVDENGRYLWHIQEILTARDPKIQKEIIQVIMEGEEEDEEEEEEEY